MKRILKLQFAVVFTALSLTSCNEDIVTNQGENSTNDLSGLTVFSSGEYNAERVSLKTSMDKQGMFYWTAGDRIFVKNGDNYVKSADAVSSKVENAKFHVDGIFTASSYPVVYTGNASDADANQVIIRAEQTQTVANDAAHIGTAGDCGNATAKKSGLVYNFNLNHRASYLVLAPRHAMKNDVKLQKVEVTTSGSDNLCGTYTFSENTMSLKDETVTSAGKTVTLNIDSWLVPSIDPFPFSADAFDGIRSFIVIQPGTHTLTFKYYVTVDGVPRTIIKEVASREFIAGAYTNVNHVLTDAPSTLNFRNGYVYVQMGADGEYKDVWETLTPILWDEQLYVDHDAMQLKLSTQSPWRDLPNVNEMYWYIVSGDPHWDETTVWTPDGGKSEKTGGVWFLKKSAILAAGKTFDSNVGLDGLDMRISKQDYFDKCVAILGKPADTTDYFFLPFTGDGWMWGEPCSDLLDGAYWSSTWGFALIFLRGTINLIYYTPSVGFVVAPSWFK